MRVFILSVFVAASCCVAGCAGTPPVAKVAAEPAKPAEEATMKVVNHACDGNGVAVVEIEATGAGKWTIGWDNKHVCGVGV